MRYVVDRSGVPVDGHRAGVIRSYARSFWAELSHKGQAPNKWKGESTLQIAENYRLQMANLCVELRLCENGWKADQIAIDNYSSWRTARIKKGQFNTAGTCKQEASEDEDAVLSPSGPTNKESEGGLGNPIPDNRPATSPKRKDVTNAAYPVKKTKHISVSVDSSSDSDPHPARERGNEKANPIDSTNPPQRAAQPSATTEAAGNVQSRPLPRMRVSVV